MKNPYLRSLFVMVVAFSNQWIAQGQETECATWPRVLPPEGLSIPNDLQATWEARIHALDKRLSAQSTSPYVDDIAVLIKACKLAIRFREFYVEKDFVKCDRLLALAELRLDQLEKHSGNAGQSRWQPDWASAIAKATKQHGATGSLQIRGFRSRVDGSVQPVGLILPEPNIGSESMKVPLYVWLHGRGDKATDLHFLCDRLDKKGEVAPAGAITLHPFGRHCVGYKNAGSTDVLEAIDFACANYPVDQNKIVLIGFSMGGAGVWHLAAHYSDRFVAASPGAGFAETARYQNLSPANYPPKYEQTLWGVNDVPAYTRNLFNIPVIAYSGELDKQIQAARIMEEAYASEGRKLEHMIGPGMGHKYHPDVLKELLARLANIAEQGKRPQPATVNLQTRHLRFAKCDWIQIDGVQRQYEDTRVEAKRSETGKWVLQTKNVSRLELVPPTATDLVVDGTSVERKPGRIARIVKDTNGKWQSVEAFQTTRKHPGMSGPIDDAFYDPFLFVSPTGKSGSAAIERWVQCEMNAAILRWTALMRGEPRVKRDMEVTDDDMRKYHLVLWGDPQSNTLIARMLKNSIVPLTWNRDDLRLGGKRWDAQLHMPALIMPNPVAANHYVVFNSSLTFREAHDRTNSLQNPHLPDWAIVSLDQPPSAELPGRIADAGFFSDDWKLE